MNEVALAIDILLKLLANAGAISTLVQRAQSEGRTTLKPEEWKVLLASDADARQALVDALSAKALKP